jgi:2-oxoisovalerate dehydrogenase E1 component
MTEDRATAVDRAFLDHLETLRPGPPRPADAPLGEGATLSVGEALAIFDAQARSRHLDFAARRLRARGAGYYTIGGAGHEGNAAVAACLRPTDPALLHYRSGGFYLARAGQVPGVDGVRDVLLGLVASREEPIAGGRHKVFGRRELSISPQTSTIASHLPRAVGLAFAIDHAAKLGVAADGPTDSVVICSFGDASLNHSTAQGALNAAAHASHRLLRLPVLFVCEDNGLGISVPTPPGWVEASARHRPGLRYLAGDGCDLLDAHRAARAAVRHVRERRRPAFLHLSMTRLLGHAGSDVELGYRPMADIRAAEARDPLRSTARHLVERGGVDPAEVRGRYERARDEVARKAEEAARRPPLSSAADVLAPLAPRSPAAVATEARRAVDPEARQAFFGEPLPEAGGPLTLAESIRTTLGELLLRYPQMLVFGEDVGRKGGVYGVTRGLAKRASPARVFDTLLDEQTILGLALGCGQHGLLPFPEIQYLAYLHNAEDQLRGEAATLSFFSQGAYRNPMVVRVASFAYQKGFGGHFHNDSSVAVLRDVPGLVIAAPCRGDDAAAMLHTCAAAAEVDGAVCAFLEPIALYHTRDLYASGDGRWCFPHRPVPEHVPLGAPRVYGDGSDLLIVTFANGVPMSLRAARALARSGIHARVMDLRWLAPLPEEALLEHARACGRVLVADETRRSGGVAEGVIAALADGGFRGAVRRVTSLDAFVPLGPAASHVLLSEAAIEEAARALVARGEMGSAPTGR